MFLELSEDLSNKNNAEYNLRSDCEPRTCTAFSSICKGILYLEIYGLEQ